MNIIELNRAAISAELAVTEISIKPFVSNEMYMDPSNKIIRQASIDIPVFRLCKDYIVDNITFSLNLLTDSTDMGSAEKFMNKVAKKVTREEAVSYLKSNKVFVYLNESFKGNK